MAVRVLRANGLTFFSLSALLVLIIAGVDASVITHWQLIAVAVKWVIAAVEGVLLYAALALYMLGLNHRRFNRKV